MKSSIRRISKYSVDQIRSQWDNIALSRDLQLRSGRDVSFEFVIKPTVLKLIQDADHSNVLDAGCGTGVLTEVLAEKAHTITGVDMSIASITIATDSKCRPKNANYISGTVEDYLTNTNEQYSLIVANMLLQDSTDLTACLNALASRCQPQALLVATITHPWFWPTYWKYDNEPWFKYSEEQGIEAPFKISNEPTPIGITTHFHRPLSLYFEKLAGAGFELETILEPMPPLDIQQQYPTVWKFPRFLAFRCRYQPKS